MSYCARYTKFYADAICKPRQEQPRRKISDIIGAKETLPKQGFILDINIRNGSNEISGVVTSFEEISHSHSVGNLHSVTTKGRAVAFRVRDPKITPIYSLEFAEDCLDKMGEGERVSIQKADTVHEKTSRAWCGNYGHLDSEGKGMHNEITLVFGADEDVQAGEALATILREKAELSPEDARSVVDNIMQKLSAQADDKGGVVGESTKKNQAAVLEVLGD